MPFPLSSAARIPALPFTYAAMQADSKAGRWQNSAPATPASRSPVPPVVMAGVPVRLKRTREPSDITSTGPLRRTVPVAAAALTHRPRAATSAGGSVPVIRANSPAWGV